MTTSDWHATGEYWLHRDHRALLELEHPVTLTARVADLLLG